MTTDNVLVNIQRLTIYSHEAKVVLFDLVQVVGSEIT